MSLRRFTGTLRIARWELTRSAGGLDRRTAAFGLLVLALAGGAVAAGLAPSPGDVALDRNVYRVGVGANSPYYEVIAANGALAAKPPSADALDAGEIDVLVRDDRVLIEDSAKSRAALAAFRSATESYNDRRMRAEEDEIAAFPVGVSLTYEDRTLSSGASGSGASGSESSEAGQAAAGSDRAAGAPFESLVLAFAFLVPMNFVVQLYGSSMLGERTNRRGELLLVAPVKPTEIVAGKTLPYFLGLAGIAAVIAATVGGGIVSVAAVVPIGLCFLAATFLGSMLARSFKELTFVTIAASVFLMSYVFVPAVFTNVTPIALISPLTLVVRDLASESVSLGEYAFSTGPFYLSGLVLFVLGTGIYREEDLFTQRAVPLKFLDALGARLRRYRSVALLSTLFIPFVFIAELLGIAVLFALPIGYSLPVLFLVIATVEELGKSVHIYAGYAQNRFETGWRTALLLGALSGVGFFLGEKLTLLAQAVGLPELALGRAAFVPSGAGGIELLALALAPLALHCVTASISAFGAHRSKRGYLIGLLGAIGVHAAYNLTVVSALV
ncbi:PrsW family intramembrane metalloprotease [Halobacteriales archaeon QS_3_64_16]|nr:MAG: PrsW family intramembrane metalloprotease [Halobacteriales archaeon QS_3_64_16]